MSLIATNNTKNILVLQVYPKNPWKWVFWGKMAPFGKIVVLYMVSNFWDHMTKTKTLCPKTKTETLKLSLKTKTWVSRTTSLAKTERNRWMTVAENKEKLPRNNTNDLTAHTYNRTAKTSSYANSIKALSEMVPIGSYIKLAKWTGFIYTWQNSPTRKRKTCCHGIQQQCN